MTTSMERTRALVQAGDFLEELRRMEPGTIPDSVREQAHRILRHYPSTMEIADIVHSDSKTNAFSQCLDPAGIPADYPKTYRR